jgi:hypothetical protein
MELYAMSSVVERKLFNTLLAALCGVAVLLCAADVRAQEEDPLKSLELKLEGECDKANSRLWVVNNHATRTIIATLRWNLAGAKRIVTDQFQVVPSARLEIGCAAQADIVVARFADAPAP